MNRKLTIVFSLVMMLSSIILAQQGTVRGTVYDEATGESIPFADVIKQGTTIGTSTDLDGTYTLHLSPGVHTVIFSYLGYSDLVVNDIEVVDGKINVFDVTITEDVEQLAEIVVTAKQMRNTDASILTLQKKSASLLDGMSSQSISRSGDGDVGAAIKRVPGVSVEDGKYVYVRGLGDRYSKTVLNGMDVPGLDPDRNAVQMDIFPTNLIDNIVVHKSFTPDLQGDFTGGMVNIVTKDFPERKTITATAGIGFNPDMHFNSNFVTYKGGNTDFLGFDDGGRALPIDKNLEIPFPTLDNPELTDITSSFSDNMSPIMQDSYLDYSLGLSVGNQIERGQVSWGYNAILNYKSNQRFYNNKTFGEFLYDPDKAELELLENRRSIADIGKTDVLLSGLMGVSMKVKEHKISLSLFHVQNGEKTAGIQNEQIFETNTAELLKQNLEYRQRSISNLLLSGKHVIIPSRLELKWNVSPTFSSIEDPDIRLTIMEITDRGDYEFNRAVGSTISRTYRDLKESNYTSKIDLTYHFKWRKNRSSKLNIGALNTFKKREYEILNATFDVQNSSSMDLTSNPDQFFQDQNLWTAEGGTGTYLTSTIFEPANVYNSDNNVVAVYIMNEMEISDRFKAIYGLRGEYFVQHMSGSNNLGTSVLNDEKVLDELDILPSLNLVYKINENSNLRASWSNTLARPSFKEKSFVQILDRISGRRFNGNIDLVPTSIQNFDFRWEYFMSGGQIFSVSTFYKSFENSIEFVSFETSPSDYQPRNVSSGELYGVEIEARKNLELIGLPRFMLGANFTLVEANTDMDEDEYESRISRARIGEEVDKTREMAGQSPYVLNAFIGYSDPDNGIDGRLTYNVQGERLSIAGIGRIPDVFEQAFNSLNFKASKNFGSWRVSVAASNILGDEKEWLYKTFGGESQKFELYKPGTSFSLSFGYSL